ncbi:Oidioi.mRNA.OKI2018_I69.chr2.g6899.t2.cds [Oikopleura dioica]|uniref:Oidioi.mRNA.OKI2018_I69.chr2.g6899.t2.cds n=1 Tax=Oikopleura dioica TaxID=34765 RepID=A0ABN7T4G5_OIKDI|nr:Oidioi.mRNA.OKI2018_I69.chr2.g6899.t2.cds [Oikopleura dioica]
MAAACPNNAWTIAADGCLPADIAITCGSSQVTVSVLVDHLYENLPEDYHDNARIEFGDCTGSNRPDANNTISETFDLNACGGRFTQDEDIFVAFYVKGVDSAASTEVQGTDIVLTPVLSFEVECEYSSTTTLESVNFDVDTPDVDYGNVTGTVGNFNDKFLMDWFSDSALENKEEVSLGDEVYIRTTSSLEASHNYRLTSCTASQGDKTIEILSQCDEGIKAGAMAILGIGEVSPATAENSGIYSFGFKVSDEILLKEKEPKNLAITEQRVPERKFSLKRVNSLAKARQSICDQFQAIRTAQTIGRIQRNVAQNRPVHFKPQRSSTVPSPNLASSKQASEDVPIHARLRVKTRGNASCRSHASPRPMTPLKDKTPSSTSPECPNRRVLAHALCDH